MSKPQRPSAARRHRHDLTKPLHLNASAFQRPIVSETQHTGAPKPQCLSITTLRHLSAEYLSARRPSASTLSRASPGTPTHQYSAPQHSSATAQQHHSNPTIQQRNSKSPYHPYTTSPSYPNTPTLQRPNHPDTSHLSNQTQMLDAS